MAAPLTEYPTPVLGPLPTGGGLAIPADGSGLAFDAGYPLTFPPDVEFDLQSFFPTIIPAVEQTVYQLVRDAASSRALFAPDGTGALLPMTFNVPPDISLFAGQDSTYPIPVGPKAGEPIPQIPVVRGWPAYPGVVPSIGVAEATSNDDVAEEMVGGGFAGDVFATDSFGNVLASATYYAEPLQVVIVVELIHENRAERDRLHDQLRRVILPMKHTLAGLTPQIRGVTIDAEKQDLPQDELPRPIYASLFSLTVSAEALIPTAITPGGVVTQIDVTVTPTIP